MNHGEEIRKLADEYYELTGESLFMGAEHRGLVTVYLFSTTTFSSGEEALGYMRGKLAEVRSREAVAVAAPDRQTFLLYCRDNRLHPDKTRHLYRPEQVQGLGDGQRIVLVFPGTSESQRFADEFLDALHAAEATDAVVVER